MVPGLPLQFAGNTWYHMVYKRSLVYGSGLDVWLHKFTKLHNSIIFMRFMKDLCIWRKWKFGAPHPVKGSSVPLSLKELWTSQHICTFSYSLWNSWMMHNSLSYMQQDGATCHTSWDYMAMIQICFQDLWSLRSPIQSPPNFLFGLP